ncbi:MAG: hypothetical protein KJ880_04595 [Candidatus Omnitrophica bacterium]|nr:hypothetical protein [Candidatus Omnitrophota bacterium]MBU1869557.1 hypothetical protein [Candidatus Omnitrophota bacterium]
MFIYLNKKGQSTAEYVIVLGLIIGVVIAMQTYIKRGLQGRVKDAVDFTDQGAQSDGSNITGQGVVQFSGKQYEPGYLKTGFETKRDVVGDVESLQEGGAVNRTLEKESSERKGTQEYLYNEDEE